MPINFITVPAVSLRAACFAHNQFENTAFRKCFSNLLSVGFKRFVVDVYWDPGRDAWGLCPAEVPPVASKQQTTRSSSILAISNSQSPVSARAVEFVAADVQPTPFPAGDRPHVQPRQATSTSRLSSVSSVLPSSEAASRSTAPSASTTSEDAIPSLVIFPSAYAEPVVEIGDYNCTATLTLSHLADILDDYIHATDTTTLASLTYLIINLHAAAPYSDPNGPAQQPSVGQMPDSDHLINDILRGNLSEEIFTPQKLQENRNDLNSSWFGTAWNLRPARGYYQTQFNSANERITQDGWPTEAYIEFDKYLRVVASLGTVDPQMSSYDFQNDFNTIFPPKEIRALRNATFDSTGVITSGCLFNPTDITVDTINNSSWALTEAPSLSLGSNPDPKQIIPSIANITSCGLSPFLNRTLNGVTADQDFRPYSSFAQSTIWSWAPGQPLNSSSNPATFENKCVAINIVPPNAGRWRTIDCQTRHRFACQDVNNPYRWQLSSITNTYFNGDTACPSNLTFSVPRTALENAHLFSAIQTSSNERPSPVPSSSIDDDPVFLNFNSIAVPDCWTIGINATCPYIGRSDSDRVRIVVVPTIAAVIIGALAALTFFVKCAANRRETMRGRRRRNVGGWEYEGVPS